MNALILNTGLDSRIGVLLRSILNILHRSVRMVTIIEVQITRGWESLIERVKQYYYSKVEYLNKQWKKLQNLVLVKEVLFSCLIL